VFILFLLHMCGWHKTDLGQRTFSFAVLRFVSRIHPFSWQHNYLQATAEDFLFCCCFQRKDGITSANSQWLTCWLIDSLNGSILCFFIHSFIHSFIISSFIISLVRFSVSFSLNSQHRRTSSRSRCAWPSKCFKRHVIIWILESV